MRQIAHSNAYASSAEFRPAAVQLPALAPSHPRSARRGPPKSRIIHF